MNVTSTIDTMSVTSTVDTVSFTSTVDTVSFTSAVDTVSVTSAIDAVSIACVSDLNNNTDNVHTITSTKVVVVDICADCSICVERLNRSTRKPVTCVFCKHVACTTCVKRYMLSSFEDPHCMSCRRTWTRDFIDTVLTKQFRSTELKRHRGEVLLDREKSMLSATQPAVELIIRKREIYVRIAALKGERDRIAEEIEDLKTMLRSGDFGEARATGPGSESVARRCFIKQCIATGCRGFLNPQYTCGVCGIRVCPDCHELISPSDNHECDASTVESIKMIARDSKPCPKCQSVIHRLVGCNQMWCTICNTAFDWLSCKIVTGRVHNPHYFEFLESRQGSGGVGVGRDPNDIPCGGLPHARMFAKAMHSAMISKPDTKLLLDILRVSTHIEDVELRHRYPAADGIHDTTNVDLRIRYMMGEISEDAFKSTLQAREIRRDKKIAINQVLQMFTNVSADSLRGLVNEVEAGGVSANVDIGRRVRQTLDELEQLRCYMNRSLAAVSKSFDACVVPIISKEWRYSVGLH